MVYQFFGDCLDSRYGNLWGGPCELVQRAGTVSLIYFLVATIFLLAVFITDLELQIIPDQYVFSLMFLNLILFLLFTADSFYIRLLSGMSAGLALLFLHVVTRGRGMGLGDVKLAVFAGSVMGLFGTLVWLTLSFVIGAVVGIVLLYMGKASFGQKIAFGPFLVVGFFIVMFWGGLISRFLFPYI